MTQFLKSKRLPTPQNYSPALRTFALTLHFYSAKAYEPLGTGSKLWMVMLGGLRLKPSELLNKTGRGKLSLLVNGGRNGYSQTSGLGWKYYHGYVNFGCESGEINESYTQKRKYKKIYTQQKKLIDQDLLELSIDLFIHLALWKSARLRNWWHGYLDIAYLPARPYPTHYWRPYTLRQKISWHWK